MRVGMRATPLAVFAKYPKKESAQNGGSGKGETDYRDLVKIVKDLRPR